MDLGNNFSKDNLDLRVNYHHIRAIEARFYGRYGRLIQVLSLALMAILVSGGVFLLINKNSLFWIVITTGFWFLVPYIYIKLHLSRMLASKKIRSINDLLSGKVLALLPENPNPKSTMQALSRSVGGLFLSGRFGLPMNQLVATTPDNPEFMESIWIESLNIWQSLPNRTETISSAVVLAAIIRLNGNNETILDNLRIDNDDIFAAASWHDHIQQRIKISEEPKLTGGIARDWSFGYIPTLENFGVNISKKYSSGDRLAASDLYSTQKIVDEMIELLSSGARRNAALIGPLGVGKSTMVEALAETIMNSQVNFPKEVKYNQVFRLDAASILSVASGRGDVERLVNLIAVESFKAKNIILFLDNAELFFADSTGSIDLSNMLQPIIEGGALKLIMAMDEQRYLQITQAKPALANALNRIQVKPTDEDSTIIIMEDQIPILEHRTNCIFTYQSLKEAYRLSSRYLHDIAQPRASIRLMENAVKHSENGYITAKSMSEAIEQAFGVKVDGNLMYGNQEDEKQKLLNLENLIHERMINQQSAVKAVASALRRARAGVRNENRPIGTFLFLGPTGVGKTELAKSLAAVYYGGEDHLIRIDMNEYVRSEDVARLLADGSSNANSLSAQVQKNPFSVVLLDEIEKAHPDVLNMLLQVLDEGQLRDINNKTISFRDTILIATSNAGADRIRQYIDAGYQVEQFSGQIQDELINSNQFRPEFLNRFDEIAVFRSLTKEELMQVVDLIMKGINKTLSLQKVSVSLNNEAKWALVNAGYDPRLGARPMRRVVQRSVENIVAEKMLSGELAPSSGIMLTAEDINTSLNG